MPGAKLSARLEELPEGEACIGVRSEPWLPAVSQMHGVETHAEFSIPMGSYELSEMLFAGLLPGVQDASATTFPFSLIMVV